MLNLRKHPAFLKGFLLLHDLRFFLLLTYVPVHTPHSFNSSYPLIIILHDAKHSINEHRADCQRCSLNNPTDE
ncbi:hypothetical protein T4D_12337 [Trichinella pseudospiralis]|uniref:Uncharacterized protein n=1 Tax=Trichinella pseudospiralis TaxID=6337 RepID=A0A0V1FGZ8_TRIPS|nr:hypothetical protein T4D_12337 [Trichinella pseudospiralis]